MNNEEFQHDDTTVVEENTSQQQEETVEEKDEIKTENVKKEKKNKYKEQISKLELEKAQLKDEFLRARAEMENTKRRLKEESIKDRKYASQNLITDLISPVDMLLKISNMETENPEINNFLIGFKMISNQLIEILKNDGLEEIEALNKDFDPTIHHAVSKEAVEGVESNKVVEVLQTGYKYKDRIIRPAMVKVSE